MSHSASPDPASTLRYQEPWAYCRVSQVVDRLNRDSFDNHSGTEMADEVRLALSLAPNNLRLKDLGNQILEKIGNATSH